MTTVSSLEDQTASTPAVPPPSDRSALDVIAATLACAGINPTDARRLGIAVLGDLQRADWLPMNPQLRHFWPIWMKWAAEKEAEKDA